MRGPYPGAFRPRAGFPEEPVAAALERWLDDGRRPPSSRTLKLSAEATPAERLTRCPPAG
ncbi:hypothetical protein [Streptomyces durocortorensis]|uniref:Uncharacterized protein n=1 Tax=Streptomyces durocortorensis TaxID=2811104 RepID=A0ABS2HTX6_9ACTN|nr:hypothetical protein [Streptomyces durocortorensis]MBM7053862.1 hypothetical protein [Streptomyces durocortorensis]